MSSVNNNSSGPIPPPPSMPPPPPPSSPRGSSGFSIGVYSSGVTVPAVPSSNASGGPSIANRISAAVTNIFGNRNNAVSSGRNNGRPTGSHTVTIGNADYQAVGSTNNIYSPEPHRDPIYEEPGAVGGEEPIYEETPLPEGDYDNITSHDVSRDDDDTSSVDGNDEHIYEETPLPEGEYDNVRGEDHIYEEVGVSADGHEIDEFSDEYDDNMSVHSMGISSNGNDISNTQVKEVVNSVLTKVDKADTKTDFRARLALTLSRQLTVEARDHLQSIFRSNIDTSKDTQLKNTLKDMVNSGDKAQLKVVLAFISGAAAIASSPPSAANMTYSTLANQVSNLGPGNTSWKEAFMDVAAAMDNKSSSDNAGILVAGTNSAILASDNTLAMMMKASAPKKGLFQSKSKHNQAVTAHNNSDIFISEEARTLTKKMERVQSSYPFASLEVITTLSKYF